jgi:hypothetical protein
MQTVESAKHFLLNKVVEQAASDNVVLSEIERRMFLFSEAMPNPDWEANERFEAKYDESEYEKKIARLLRHAYTHDKKSGVDGAWRDCLKALKEEDFYGLVMVDQAKIPRPRTHLPDLDGFIFAEGTLIALAVGVFTNVIHLHLLSSDTVRLVVAVLLVIAAWGVGEADRRYTNHKLDQSRRNHDLPSISER